MTDITISVGESRHCTNWVPKTVSWQRLCKKLSTPKITEETAEEYEAMTKDQRINTKDVGGFVGGRINGGNRKSGSITERQLICLDADYGDLGLWDVWELIISKACLMHTSHSHTKEKPRLRFVIPLARPVTTEEYEPIARRLAEWLDIDAFDDTTYETARLMFWPSCPSDGEFIVRIDDSTEWVDPDAILATYDDWHDVRSWPTSSRQQTIIEKNSRLQGDPLTKPGVIGAFNRAYTISDAIETYLPGVYTRMAENRWTYAAGTTVGGAVTYDNDTFIFSHHDSDPVSGRLCNAFDLVRLHLYGTQDEGSEEDLPNLPSMQAMKDLCSRDEKVVAELAEGLKAEDIFERMLQRFNGDLTEQGLALQFADDYGQNLRYSKVFGWMYWDGTRWVLDAEAEAGMLTMQFTDDLYESARKHTQLATDKVQKEQAKREMMIATKLRSASGISHLMSLTKFIVNEPEPASYDASPWDMNTPDGIINLQTGEIRQHDKDARCTKCTSVSPGSLGTEQWYDFVSYITSGNAKFAEYLQTLAGMAAVGAVYEEGLVISHGPGGNGKSTFFGALTGVLGDYARTLNADVMVANDRGNIDQSYVAALRGVRLAVMGETEEDARLSVSQMKRITSRDTITARALYKDPIEFTPTHTIVMHTNHLPRVGSLDGGTRRRIAVAPFPATLPPEKVITNYCQVLVTNCGPAILQWIIEGAVRFYAAGCKLHKPETVQQATQKYIQGEDWLGTFLEEECEEAADNKQPGGELYSAYQRWANARGDYVRRGSVFSQALEDAGYQKLKMKGKKYWIGLKIRDEV